MLSVDGLQALSAALSRSVPLALLAALATRLLLHWLIPVLRRRLPDAPNARSAHQRVTPRGGGIAFVLIAAVASMVWGPAVGGVAWLPLLALPLAVVGLADDRFNLPASARFAVQLATAFGVLQVSPAPAVWPLPVLLLPVLVVSIAAVINFTNFMDGLDGLVAGCLVVMLSAAVVALSGSADSSTRLLPIVALIGALVGFLLCNWSPAQVFMGDVGSTFLGVVFAGLVLQLPSPPEALGLLLVGFPLLGDAFLCVVARSMAGQPLAQAHRLHLYQRLQRAGWSHARVAILYIGATACLALAYGHAGLPGVISVSLVVLAMGCWLDRFVAVPFSVVSSEVVRRAPPRVAHDPDQGSP